MAEKATEPAPRGKKERKEPILFFLIASVILFVPNALLAFVAASEHRRAIPGSAMIALDAIALAGLVAFVLNAIAIVKCIRRREPAAPRQLLAFPAAVVALGAISGLVVSMIGESSSSSSPEHHISRVFPLLLSPALACASGILSVSAMGLALRSVRRAKERVLDERVITVLLYGTITWLAISVQYVGADIMAYTFVAAASGLIAITIFAVGRDGNTDDDARWIVGLSIGALVCAIAMTFCIHRAQMMATELDSLDDKSLRMTIALDLGQGPLYLLPIAGAAAAACLRRLTAPLLLLAAFTWVLLIVVAAYPALSPSHTAYKDLPPFADSYGAVIALALAASAWLIALFSFERLINPSCPLPSWKIAIAPFVLILAMTLLVQLISFGEYSYYGDIGEPKHQHSTDGLRLQSFWWVGILGVLSIVLAMVILTLRSTAADRSDESVTPPRADARARIVLAGGWLLLCGAAAAGFVTTTKATGAWVHILVALAPVALAFHFLYLGSRKIAVAKEEPTRDKAILDLTLVGLLALLALGIVYVAVEARLDVSRSTPDANRMLFSLSAMERRVPRLVVVPVIGAIGVALSSRVRLRALAKHARVVLGVAAIGAAVTMCMFALACSAGIRYQVQFFTDDQHSMKDKDASTK